MDSSRLTREQYRQMHDKIYPTFQYLARLQNRMKELHFSDKDPLWHTVEEARSAMQNLRMHLHYVHCEVGTGRIRRD